MRDDKNGKLPAALRAIFESAGVPRIPVGPVGRVPIVSPDLDDMSFELFDRLRNDGSDDLSLEERRRFLSVSARLLLGTDAVDENIIRESLDQLADDQREAITLHLAGLNYKQIAERMDMDPEDLVKRLANAYARIRLEL